MRYAFRLRLHQTSWQAVQAVFTTADRLDVFESGWVADHLYPTDGDPAGPCLEAWTTLTALAAVTERLRLGVLVSSMPYRHPAVLANMAATVDHVSDGRLELGLGAGWSQEECDAYGIDLLPLGPRFDAFEEACEVVTRLLSEDVTDFAGEHYRLTAARCEPKPVQRPRPPLCIGGAGERRALRAVARYADHWNVRRGTLDVLPHKRAVLASHCQEAGRDPADIRVSMDLPFGGDTARLPEHARALEAAGVDLGIVRLPEPHDPDQLEEVAAALAEA